MLKDLLLKFLDPDIEHLLATGGGVVLDYYIDCLTSVDSVFSGDKAPLNVTMFPYM